MSRRIVLGLAVCAAVFGVASAVQASIPDGSGVIHACYNTSLAHGSPTGALRVIDTSAVNGRCASWEAPLSWAQRGVTGPTGATGARGPTGPGFGELAFDAQSMHDFGATVPDFFIQITATVTVNGWVLTPPPGTRTVSLDVPVPHDFVDSPTETLVSVDFVSNPSPRFPPPSGVVALELDAGATPVGQSLEHPPTAYVQMVPGVTGDDVNHYRAVFPLDLPLSAGDSLVLAVTRNVTGDTYPANVDVTDVSFRYKQS